MEILVAQGVPSWILNDSTDELYMALNFDCISSRERELALAEIKRREVNLQRSSV
jgi:hypothetical protein